MRTSPNLIAAWLRKYTLVSERTVALTFAEHRGEEWCYDADEGMWLHWVGTHWSRRRTPEMMDALGHFLAEFAKGFRAAQQISAAEANKFQSQKTVAAVERICRGLPSFLTRSDKFDGDPFALGTPDGTIDLRTGEMRMASPGDYITIITPIAPAPPGTPLGPRFGKFMDDITGGDKDFQKTLRQYAGCGAEGTSRDQRVLFLYGSGGNGKGVYLRTIAGLLGGHAVNAPRDLLMLEKYSGHATHLIAVLKARMAMATEVDDDATWDTALIKNLTGGDAMSVNRMRQDPFEILARCSITISGNKKPALKGIDDAVRRRFLVATFHLKLEPGDVITDLEKQFIAEEGPAILRWIIDGAVEREAEGRLHVARVIADDTQEYFEDEDTLSDFISTHLSTGTGAEVPQWREKTAAVYAVWKGFCIASGRPVGAQNAFTTAMQAAGVVFHRTKAGRYFINVRMKSGMELD